MRVLIYKKGFHVYKIFYRFTPIQEVETIPFNDLHATTVLNCFHYPRSIFPKKELFEKSKMILCKHSNLFVWML